MLFLADGRLSPRSAILRNDNGKFVDVTENVAPELVEIGLVTGATWSHIDENGWVDLVVVTEWGPVSVLCNDQGKFENVTEKLGLSDDTGWWNGVATADVDNDGDLDLIATNFGLNTKYHANHQHPSQLFVSDFDEDGRLDLVEAEWEGDTCFPVRGRSCSSHAMPFIKDKFESYHDFGLAELNEIYTSNALDESTKFSASRLESVLIINNGLSQPWSIKNLPRLAQASPGFGIITTDFDSDGFVDIFFVQNFMEPQPETGQMDGGVGCLLRGQVNGEFEFVYAGESGIVVRHQGMAATKVDLNNDQRPDIALTTNNAAMAAYTNAATSNFRAQKIDLVGSKGNKNAVGSIVKIVHEDGLTRSHDVSAGSGYLSQSSSSIFIASGDDNPITKIVVTWPSGETTSHKIDQAVPVIEIQQAK